MPYIEVPFVVEQNYAGWRLDRYLQEKISRLSRSKIQFLIRERLRHDGQGVLKPATPVKAGMRFVLLRKPDPEPEPKTPWEVGIVHDDADLFVVNKPAGLAVHPSARWYRQTLTHWMSEHALDSKGRRPDLGHRLDRETSGLVACGRHVDATRALKRAFANREVGKRYQALVSGRFEQEEVMVDAPLRLMEREVKIFMEVHPEGQESQTRIRRLRHGRFGRDGEWVTLVECEPITGRQHQIRVHLRSLGHPIVGDKMYSAEPERFLRFCDGELSEEDLLDLRLPRQALHASALELPHPKTGERLILQAPFPRDLQSFMDEEIEWLD